jgi:hypothetical protein
MSKNHFKRIKDKGDKNTIKTPEKHLPNIPFLGIISGKTGSGKTTNLVNLIGSKDHLRKYFKPQNCYIFSPLINDYKMDGLISSMKIPDLNIFQDLDAELLDSLYDTLAEQYADEMLNFDKVEPKLILIDDFGYNSLMRKRENNVISRFFSNCRKHLISLFVVNQHYVQNLPVCRSNANYLMIFNTNDKNLDVISDENNYLSSKKEFKKKMRENLIENHDFIIINYFNTRDEGLYLNKDFEKIA